MKITKEMEFGAYCLLKPGMIFKVVDAGIKDFEDYKSIMYPLFLKERRKYKKEIIEMNNIIKRAVIKIILKGGNKKWKKKN